MMITQSENDFLKIHFLKRIDGNGALISISYHLVQKTDPQHNQEGDEIYPPHSSMFQWLTYLFGRKLFTPEETCSRINIKNRIS